MCHKCDNPPCVNPKHLFLGTFKDNNRDAVRKGRSRHHFLENLGEDHPRTSVKLTKEQVTLIRQQLDVGCREFGRRLEVSSSTISSIRRGKKWKWFV